MLGEIKSCARAKKELCGWDFFVIIKTLEMFHADCGKLFCRSLWALRVGILLGDGNNGERIKKSIE
jgi:hypothetical protein